MRRPRPSGKTAGLTNFGAAGSPMKNGATASWNLVREPGRQELRVDAAAAFDHQPPDPALTEIVQERGEVQLGAEAGHLRKVAEPVPHLAGGGIGNVHELVATVVPELQAGIKVAAGGQGYLQRVGRQPACLSLSSALRRLDQQARRSVTAPIRIASHSARTWSTRSKSASLDSSSRSAVVSSMKPSIDIAQLRSTYGRVPI